MAISEPLTFIPQWGIVRWGLNLTIDPSTPPIFGDKPWVIDVENNKDGSFAGLGLYDGGQNVYYWSKPPKELPKKVIAHNGNTDLHKLKAWDYELPEMVWDTEIAVYAEDTTAKVGLKDQAALQGIHYPTFYELVKKAKGIKTLDDHVNLLLNWQYDPSKPSKRLTEDTKWDFQPSELPVEILAQYNAMDCVVPLLLYKEQSAKPISYYKELDLPLAQVLFAMEERGIRVDQAKLQEAKKSLLAESTMLKDQITQHLGPINLNSPKQLLEALNKIGISPTLKKKPSTDKKALAMYADEPVIQALLSYSEVSTLLDSFITPYEAFGDSVVHPWFNQCRTRTTRLACSRPNLQQIPIKTENGKLIRDFIIPASKDKHFTVKDFGQIEPRVMAHLSKDKAFVDMFCEGINFHTYTAERMKIARDAAKVLNLSVGYRATKFSVAKQLDIPHWEAQKVIDAWWSMFPRLAEWEEQILAQARKDGYVTTLYGRRIKVDNLDSLDQFKREHAERQAINNLVQGSASEINRKALIELHRNKAPICISVHDEVVIEIDPLDKETDECYTSIMEHCVDLDVPLVVESGIGPSWQRAKEK